MVVARVEEAARQVAEVSDDEVSEFARGFEPLRVERRAVELQQPCGARRMILKIAAETRHAAAPGAIHPASLVAHLPEQEPCGLLGHSAVVVPSEHARGLGERRKREAVPAGQHLVVEPRPHALLASREKRVAHAIEALPRLGLLHAFGFRDLLRHHHEREHSAPLEVPLGHDAEGLRGELHIPVRADVCKRVAHVL